MKSVRDFLLAIAIAVFAVSGLSSAAELGDNLSFDNLTTWDGLSQMTVLSMCQDSQGYIWLGTRGGLNRYDGKDFKTFRYDRSDTLSISGDIVRGIAEDGDGTIWVATFTGLCSYDKVTDSFHRYILDSSGKTSYNVRSLYVDPVDGAIFVGGTFGLGRVNLATGVVETLPIHCGRVNAILRSGSLLYVGANSGLFIIDMESDRIASSSPFGDVNAGADVEVRHLFIDSYGELWAGTQRNGVARLDSDGTALEHYPIRKAGSSRNSEVRGFCRYGDSDLLIGTDWGLVVYDREHNEMIHLDDCGMDYTVESLFTDAVGSLWVGTYYNGVFHSNPYGMRFGFHDPGKEYVRIGAMGPMVCDGDILWIGTESGGLVRYDIHTEETRVFPCVQDSPVPARDNNAKCILVEDDCVWVGLYSGWLYKFDKRSGRYTFGTRNPSGNSITSLTRGRFGRLLIGTSGLKELSGDKIVEYHVPGVGMENVPHISAMCQTSHGLYIGTRSGGLYRYNGKTLEKFGSSDDSGSPGQLISCITEVSDGKVLVGSSDAGLQIFDSANGTSVRLTAEDGLNDNRVCSCIEDAKGRVWVVTQSAVSLLDAGYHVARTYSYSSGIGVHEFSVNSIALSDSNVIFAGGNNGFVSFSANDLKSNDNVPPVLISYVRVNNEPLAIDLSKDETLKLKSSQNSITIAYNSLNFISPEQNQYACRLLGAKDDSWQSLGNQASVTYGNLSPGRYKFMVKGSNNNGVWNEEGDSLSFVIRRPFYFSTVAFILYFLLLAGAMYFVYKLLFTLTELENEKMLKKREGEFFRERINMFTNFSHELRTPLTLIKGPIEEVVQSGDPALMSMDAFRMAYNNINRLQLLVDQIMTFRKEEEGSLKPRVFRGDFIGFAREMKIAFGELARLRGIDLRMEEGNVPSDVWYDRNLFERVLMNLLSNAFKFTPDRGMVKLSLDSVGNEALGQIPQPLCSHLFTDVGEYLRIIVEDSGPGVDEADRLKIFDPFFQSDKNRAGGTGIGLTVSRLIVDMHHGAIWVSDRDGAPGARFTILLPTGNSHFDESEIIKDYQDSESLSRYHEEVPEKEEGAAEQQELGIRPHPDCTILVVEDNNELRRYITSKLKQYFKVLEASNGREGQIMALTNIPNLILSDIMMPVMDGLQMCRMIKDDQRTCHIPVILLTARTFVLQMKEGLEFGADDYINKPFNIDALILKISNMIESRENLKNLYARGLSLENMGVEIISSDDRFLQKLNQVVQQNITNPNLEVEDFCSLLGMSRATLYRKLQGATGMSPSKYLQTVRLHLAAKMLKETDLAIFEVMDAVGFSNQAHFSTLFRKRYGVPPMRFREEGSLEAPCPPED